MKKRKQKLVLPSVQIRLMLAFLCCATLGVIIQALVVHYGLTQLAAELPNDRLDVMELTPSVLAKGLMIAFAFLAPLTMLVGLNVTFRIVGPLRRIEDFMRRTAAGERLPDCRIRKGDQLQEFCRLLNQVTAPVRAGQLDAPTSTIKDGEAA